MTMTPDELQALDRMLAEKVMKFSVRTEIGRDYGGDFPPDAAEYFHLDGKDICEIWNWHPTTDIAQAFMVAEKIGKLKLLRLSADWYACYNDDSDFSGFGDTPALAICLAAKAWLERGGDAK